MISFNKNSNNIKSEPPALQVMILGGEWWCHCPSHARVQSLATLLKHGNVKCSRSKVATLVCVCKCGCINYESALQEFDCWGCRHRISLHVVERRFNIA